MERELLKSLSPLQLQLYLEGADAAEIFLLTGESLDAFLKRGGMDIFQLVWYSIDSGGGKTQAAEFRLWGSIGQPDAGVLSGGSFTLLGGFLGPVTGEEPCVGSDAIFCDGFESGDASAWSSP